MPKLTNEQIRLLIWLSLSKTHFEVCRQVGYSYRQVNGLKSYVNKDGVPYKFDTRTLDKLVNENLVTSEFVYPIGIKYEHYFLTQAGQDFVSMFTANT
jgi:hypothetical protein